MYIFFICDIYFMFNVYVMSIDNIDSHEKWLVDSSNSNLTDFELQWSLTADQMKSVGMFLDICSKIWESSWLEKWTYGVLLSNNDDSCDLYLSEGLITLTEDLDTYSLRLNSDDCTLSCFHITPEKTSSLFPEKFVVKVNNFLASFDKSEDKSVQLCDDDQFGLSPDEELTFDERLPFECWLDCCICSDIEYSKLIFDEVCSIVRDGLWLNNWVDKADAYYKVGGENVHLFLRWDVISFYFLVSESPFVYDNYELYYADDWKLYCSVYKSCEQNIDWSLSIDWSFSIDWGFSIDWISSNIEYPVTLDSFKKFLNIFLSKYKNSDSKKLLENS